MITLKEAKGMFETETQTEVSDISVLEGGMAGMVFRVIDINQIEVVFKLYEKKDMTEEKVDDRVYGSNHQNLQSTYTLLQEKGVPTFKLIQTGESNNYTYAVLSLLEGQETNQEIVKDRIYGETLGELHSITRDFQGWVSKNDPYGIDWKTAFSQSIYSRLSNVNGVLSDELYSKIKEYIDVSVQQLNNPEKYVLSHLDGLQALFQKKEQGWKLSGVIDIEDYQFTDQRFVLAGITLNQLFGKYQLTEDFWSTYGSIVDIDKTFKEFEVFFQVYYLLVWIVVHNNFSNNDEQAECEKVLASIV